MRYGSDSPFSTLMRKFSAVVITAVGLVFLGVGIFLMISNTWTPADGLVQNCVTRMSSSSSSGARTFQQDCSVTWQVDGQTHTSNVTFGGASMRPGSHAKLRVHGDTATEAAPAWVGYFFAGLGVVAVGGVAFFSVRKRRRVKGADLDLVGNAIRSE